MIVAGVRLTAKGSTKAAGACDRRTIDSMSLASG